MTKKERIEAARKRIEELEDLSRSGLKNDKKGRNRVE